MFSEGSRIHTLPKICSGNPMYANTKPIGKYSRVTRPDKLTGAAITRFEGRWLHDVLLVVIECRVRTVL